MLFLSSLFRTLNTKTALTAIEFSPEGAAIYLGTENGKLLVVDLRGLDKPPKAVVVSDTGRRVETISVQVRSTFPSWRGQLLSFDVEEGQTNCRRWDKDSDYYNI